MLDVNPIDTIAEVKERIHRKEDIPVAKQQLTFNGHPLRDDFTLWDSDVQWGAVVDLSILR